jgi:hypothetical protein
MFPTTRITRLLGCVGVATLFGAGLAAVAPAVTATAAVPGLITVQAASPSNSVGKAVTKSCPNGKVVVGAGGYVTGVVGQVTLDDITPNPGMHSVTVTGYETDGTGKNWRVHAVAKCARRLPGQVEEFQPSANDSSSSKSATVKCPTGTKVIGVGSQTTGGSNGDVITNRIAPNRGLRSATVSAREDGSDPRNWEIIAYAICADPLPGLVRVPGSTTNSANKIENVICPAGRVAIGAGARVTGALDDAMFGSLQTAGAVSLATGVEEDPVPGLWTLTTIGICARR